MNKANRNTRFNRLTLLLCLIATSTTLILGCRSVQTGPAKAGSDGSIEGITYSLPRSYLKISIESKKDAKGNHAELLVGAGPEIVPDKAARMVLNRSANELFTRNHTFNFTNSLLSSVVIDDEGKTGEVVEDLAAIAINVISMGALPSPITAMHAAPPPPRTAFPGDEEKLAALTSITVGQHLFVLDIKGSSANTALPGTRGLITFTAVTKDLPQNLKANDGADKITPFSGVAVKLPEPYPVTVALQMDRKVMFQQRIEAAKTSQADLTKQKADNDIAIAKIDKELKANPAPSAVRRAKLEEQFKDLTDANTEIDKSIAAVKKSIADNEGFKSTLPDNDPQRFFELATQVTVVMFPDFSPIVKIPLDRAPLGKTKYTLSMSKGVLTDFHAENPSSVVEVVKVPLNISKALVSLPTEILQLKIDYSSKAKELAAKQAEYLEAEKALKKARTGPTQDEQNLTGLQQQKDILSLQKDIATLKATIAEIEAKSP